LRRTPSDVLAAYRGFEGAIWPEPTPLVASGDALASVGQLSAVRHYVSALALTRTVELLYCRLGESERRGTVPAGFTPLGFDVGFLNGADDVYSRVFHELLFGTNASLTRWVLSLNEHLLFGAFEDALGFRDACESLVAAGADLEQGEEASQVVLVARSVASVVGGTGGTRA
jgi:hypothetical protein